jgi:threonine/homoserine/homoserine lactone efflux protein
MDDLNLYLPGILLAYLTFLIAVASPGPNVLAVIGTSMNTGRSSGLALALGIGMGAFSWAVLAAAGLSTLLATYASALLAIKIAGGCYLLWLAYKSFQSAASREDPQARELAAGLRSRADYLLSGYVVCMTNPKAILAWVAIMSMGLKPDAPWWVAVVIVAGTSLLSTIIHCLYATAFSTPIAARIYLRSRRYVQAGLGVLFAGAGLKLLASRT